MEWHDALSALQRDSGHRLKVQDFKMRGSRYFYAAGGAFVVWASSYALFPEGWRFGILATTCALLTGAAWVLSSKPFGLAAVGLALLAAFPAGTNELGSHVRFEAWQELLGLAALFVVALASDGHRAGITRGLGIHQLRAVPYLLYGVFAWLAGIMMTTQLPMPDAVLAMTSAGVVAAMLVFALHPTVMTLMSVFFLAWAGGFDCLFMAFHGPDADWRRATWALMIACVFADRLIAAARSKTRIAAFMPWVLLTELTFLAWLYIAHEAPGSWMAACMAVVAFALAAYGVVFRSPAGIVLGVATTAMVSLQHVAWSTRADVFDAGVVLGFVVPAVFWVCWSGGWRGSMRLRGAGRINATADGADCADD